MNIQDEMQKIHHKYGVSEKANYEIEKFVEKLIEDDRAEQLILHLVSHCDPRKQPVIFWDGIIQDIADKELILIDNRILNYLKENFEPPKRK